MHWFFYVFISTVLFSLVNIIDTHLINKVLKNSVLIIFYTFIAGLILLPIIFLFGKPAMPSLNMLLLLFLASIFLIAYLFPYYKALQQTDTSVVLSLFSLGYIFVPILAYIFIGEKLMYYHYIGIAVIIFGSFMITYGGKLGFNKALIYMLVSSLLLAGGDIILKYGVGKLDWITVFFWTVIFEFAIMILFTIIFYRTELQKSFGKAITNIHYFFIMETVAIIGTILMLYAYTTAPVTLAKGVEVTKPLILLIIAIIGKSLLPKFFKEKTDIKNILKKSAYFVLMIIGIILLIS